MLDRKTKKQKSFAVQKPVPIPENISFLSSCLEYLPIEQLFQQQRPIASRYTTQQVYSKPRINRKPYQVYLNRKYTIASPKTINNTKKSIREGKVQFGEKVTSFNANLQKIVNDAQRNKNVRKLFQKTKKPKNSIKQSKLMRVKSLELQPDSLDKKYPSSNPQFSPKKIQVPKQDKLQYANFMFKNPQKRPMQKMISNLNVSNPYTPKKLTNIEPIFASASITPKIKTYQQNTEVKRVFYQNPLRNQQKISQPIIAHKIDVPHQNLISMPSKQNLQNNFNKQTQYSSEKTQRKRSIDDDTNFIYRDLKKIQLKEEQNKVDDKDNIKQIIKSKFKALDLSSTKKQGFHQSGKFSINDQISQKKEHLQIKILNSAIEKYQNEELIDKQPNMQLQMLKKSSISNGQFAKPIISKYQLPQSNIVQSKYQNNFLNPQYSDLYTDARRFGGSQVSGNLNPISSKKNLGACLGGLSSMTVNSYMQSVRQSKVVHKVQESVVMMDFFNPPKQSSYNG